MTLLPFTKMHGLGNDFVVIDATQQPLPPLNVKVLANRHMGIGFDQLLIIEPSQQADFFCRILNADGSQAEQCGNGLRCVARFLHESNMHPSSSLTLETVAGIFPIHIQNYDHIRITLGNPEVKAALVNVDLKTQSLPLSIINTGNPHAILKVNELPNNLADLSHEIATHEFFPDGVNVGFIQIINPQHARLRTFERGAGETLACGSNACAAAVAGILNGWLTRSPKIEFQLGSLMIEWEGEGYPLFMTGPATHVFSGTIAIK